MPNWLTSLPRLAWLACAGNPMERSVPVMPQADVPWSQLQVGELLGEGASGRIYRAVWQAPDAEPVPVAVKLFKGEVTSDGLPQSEMAASLAAGAHPHLIPVAGRLQGHPEGTPGLVMHFVPATFRTLAEPPSLASCTRDVYPATTVFTAAAVQRIAHGAASALQHLHAQGLLHGDFYAHNLQCDAAGQALLGDMGAASVLPSDPVAARALQRLEVRAFGCLLEELLERMDENAGMSQRQAWCRLRDDCLQEDTAARPLFADIAARLSD
jgi:serine/threonine protein kinase